MKVTVLKLEGRRSPWCVRYYVKRRPDRQFFRTRDAAEKRAAEIRTIHQRGGNLAAIGSAVSLIAGTGYELDAVVRAGLQRLQQQAASSSSPNAKFRDGVNAILRRSEKRQLRSRTINNYNDIYRVINRTFGDRIAASITNEEVDAFLESIPDRARNVGKGSLYSRHTYLTNVRMALKAAGVLNPLPGLAVAIPLEREIDFFTVAEVKTLYSLADASERGALTLAGFVGVRPERMEELPPDCVNVSERTIHIPAALSKNHRSILLETPTGEVGPGEFPGVPEVVWQWLEQYPFKPLVWQPFQRRLAAHLGRWIHDGLRHTAATYYRARFGLAATTELLTHVSGGLVSRHYAGFTSRANANAFYAITPDAVGPAREGKIPDPRIKIRCSREELECLLQTKTLTEIGEIFGSSGVSVTRCCRKFGIPTPGRGHWVTRVDEKI